jgi:hypothetical protein
MKFSSSIDSFVYRIEAGLAAEVFVATIIRAAFNIIQSLNGQQNYMLATDKR